MTRARVSFKPRLCRPSASPAPWSGVGVGLLTEIPWAMLPRKDTPRSGTQRRGNQRDKGVAHRCAQVGHIHRVIRVANTGRHNCAVGMPVMAGQRCIGWRHSVAASIN